MTIAFYSVSQGTYVDKIVITGYVSAVPWDLYGQSSTGGGFWEPRYETGNFSIELTTEVSNCSIWSFSGRLGAEDTGVYLGWFEGCDSSSESSSSSSEGYSSSSSSLQYSSSSSSSSSSSLEYSSSSSSVEYSSSSSNSSSSTSSSNSSSSTSSLEYSSSSSISSSSSSSFELTKILNSVLVEQGHHNLLPFSFIAEPGFSTDPSTLTFSLRTSQTQYLDYNAIIASANTITVSNTLGINDTYVPQEDETKYKHDAITYVDIISGDARGINKVSVRNETNRYDMNDPSYSFVIPKFTWDNTLFKAVSNANAISTTYSSTIWAGAGEKNIYRVGYNAEGASITYTANTTAETYGLVFEDGNYLFVTDYNYLSRFLVNSYLATKNTIFVEAEQDLTMANNQNDIISYYDHENSRLYSVESYSGKLLVRDPNTLAIISTYSGLDAPFKVIKSDYHNSFFIAGTNILWKLNGTTISEAYKVGGYRIKDISCSENGNICILLNGNSRDIIRILGKNLYDISFNEYITNGNARYCEYCGQGIFYVLVELYSNISVTTDSAYIANHYLFDINDKSFKIVPTLSSIVTTTTTTTSKQTIEAVEIEAPNGAEQIQLDTVYDIKWASNKSIKDTVKIELYKEDVLYDVIVAEAPNTGIYQWNVSRSLGLGNQFKIKITWLTASSNVANYDFSDNVFELVETAITTTTTTTQIILNEAVGIDYDAVANRVVILLRNGLMGYLNIGSEDFYGMFDTGLGNALCMVAHNDLVKEYSAVTKARVFVGTEPYLNNMWDSGIIETNLSSIFYGGGNNLVPGEKYYVNIQVYSETYGWSELQIKTWIMPR